MKKTITLIVVIGVSFIAYAQMKQSGSEHEAVHDSFAVVSPKVNKGQTTAMDNPTLNREDREAESQAHSPQNQAANSSATDDSISQNQTTAGDDEQAPEEGNGIDTGNDSKDDMNNMGDNSADEDTDSDDMGTTVQPS